MSKPVISALIVVGFLFFLFGMVFRHPSALFGLVAIGIGIFQGVGPGGILTKEQVLDTWSMLIGGAQGRANEILQNTEGAIKNSQAPSITMERKLISPGIIRGLAGAEREFLVVTDEARIKLKPYKAFLNARDYGNNLDVSWYLTYKPSFWQSLASLLPFINAISETLHDLDLFDQQDLRAYVTVAHHSMIGSVEKIMLSLNQDPAKIDRKSKGFLGIS
jgi:hypothetical protein